MDDGDEKNPMKLEQGQRHGDCRSRQENRPEPKLEWLWG
jgi:hypothetical protein